MKKNIEVKIISKEQAFWEEVKKLTSTQKEGLEKQLKLQNAIIDLCDSKIKAESDELQDKK